jgi:hypothetical protein
MEVFYQNLSLKFQILKNKKTGPGFLGRQGAVWREEVRLKA